MLRESSDLKDLWVLIKEDSVCESYTNKVTSNKVFLLTLSYFMIYNNKYNNLLYILFIYSRIILRKNLC